jgi:hypothetical protein
MKVKLSDPRRLESVSSNPMPIRRLLLRQPTQVRNPEVHLNILNIGEDNLAVN